MSEFRQIGPARLYLGDSLAILDEIATGVTALVTDQPYGVNYKVNARRSQNEGLDSVKPWSMEKQEAIAGDDRPFDPAPFLRFAKMAFFGANHCAHALPPGGSWIVWDKRRDSQPDDHSDCELIWTNLKGADRIHRQKWRGIVREGEENCSRSRKLHRNQKPVALMTFVMQHLDLVVGDTVLDPFMGSGSTGVAAVRLGLNFVGVEIDPTHFGVAVARLEAEWAEVSPKQAA